MNDLGFGFNFVLNDMTSPAAASISNSFKGLVSTTMGASQKIGGAMDNMAASMNLQGMRDSLLAPLQAVVGASSNFDAQMSSIKAVTGSTADEMSAFRAEALKAGADTKFSSLEAAQGIEELAKAGVATSAIVGGGLTDALNLAVAGEVSVAQAAEMASTALNSFKKDGLSIAQVGNILSGAANASATSVSELKFGLSAVAAVASGAGLSFKDTNTALAVLAQNGLKGSDAGTSLKTMLMNLSPATKGAREEMRKLGLITSTGQNQFFDATGRLKSFAEISGTLQSALANLNPKQQGDALREMFGSDAIRAGNIFLKEGSLGITKMAEAMGKVSAADVAKERLNNFKGSMEMLKGSIETLAINVGSQLTPALKMVADWANKGVDAFNAFVETPVGGFVVKVAAGLTGLAVAGLSVAIGAVQMGAAFTALSGVMAGLGITSAAALAPLLPFVGAAVAVGGAVYFMVEAWDSFSVAMEKGNATYGQFADSGIMGFMQKLGGLMQGVSAIWESATSKGFSIDADLNTALQDVGILDMALSIGTWITRIKGFFEGVSFGIDQFKGRLEPVFDTFLKFGNMMVDVLSKTFGGFGRNEDAMGGFIQAGADLTAFILTPMVRSLELMAGFANWVMQVEQETGALSMSWSLLTNIFGVAFDVVQAGFGAAWNTLTAFGSAVFGTVTAIGNLFSNESYTIGQMVSDIFSSWGKAIWDMVSGVFTNFGGLAADLMERIGLTDQAEALRGKLSTGINIEAKGQNLMSKGEVLQNKIGNLFGTSQGITGASGQTQQQGQYVVPRNPVPSYQQSASQSPSVIMAQSQGNQAPVFSPNITTPQPVVEKIEVVVEVDGRTLAKTVNSHNQREKGRE